ncbi:hypothetical protein GFY24_21395 [Nocardia sp. SYP-A9097]|uniref:hypothetical protein n=1 Tax=Nocardia sp. SYP-A9097 TaxID=2663237 RepID=UPI00129A98F8|nr:hypothetical protein [Nocardia sp. SYP-A9097]MRH89962.1 hypothetical protein [Nocardia sp. SYP-A9097]
MSSETAAPRSYSLRDLAETYVLAQANWSDPIGGYVQENTSYNAALRKYRERLLEALEGLYGLTLEMGQMVEIPRGTVLFMHFKRTVSSCLALRTPGSGYLEAGLLLRSLEAAGDPGRRVLETSTRIDKFMDQSREAHLDILEDLLRILVGGNAALTFTAEDLRSLGVDDTPPVAADFLSAAE